MRCAETGSYDLTKQSLEVLSHAKVTIAPGAVNRGALGANIHDPVLMRAVCLPRLHRMRERHWNASIRAAVNAVIDVLMKIDSSHDAAVLKAVRVAVSPPPCAVVLDEVDSKAAIDVAHCGAAAAKTSTAVC